MDGVNRQMFERKAVRVIIKGGRVKNPDRCVCCGGFIGTGRGIYRRNYLCERCREGAASPTRKGFEP